MDVPEGRLKIALQLATCVVVEKVQLGEAPVTGPLVDSQAISSSVTAAPPLEGICICAAPTFLMTKDTAHVVPVQET